MENAPRVSFLMAVHNDARFLPETLAGILTQTYRDFELVIVDDHSTDGSTEILQAASDPRFRYYRNLSNLGLIRSLNFGLTLCRGEYIARIDGDDICEANRLHEQVRYMDTHPALAGCATWTTEIDEEGQPIGCMEPHGDPEYIRWLLCFVNRLYHPTMLLRRQPLERSGGYDERFPANEDYELWTRMMFEGALFGVVEQPLLRYRRRRGSITDTHRSLQRRLGLTIATRHVNAVLNTSWDAETVDIMRQLLAWQHIDPAAATADNVRNALRLMRALRLVLTRRAPVAARTVADTEVGQRLLRQGRFLLSKDPLVSAQLARYVSRLTPYRRNGYMLLLTAGRCIAGTTRKRILHLGNHAGIR